MEREYNMSKVKNSEAIQQFIEEEDNIKKDFYRSLGLEVIKKSNANTVDEAKKFIDDLISPNDFQEIGHYFIKKYNSFLPDYEIDFFDLLDKLTKKKRKIQ